MSSAAATTVASETNLDALVASVAKNRKRWRDLGYGEKLRYLERIGDLAERHAERLAAASAAIRGVPIGGATPHMEGATWLSGVALLGSTLNTLRRTFEHLSTTGRFPPLAERQRTDGRRVLTAFPYDRIDTVYLPRFRAEIWTKPDAPASRGRSYTEAEPATCLILGAGNYDAPVDILTKMFTHDHVVVYKPNPVNARAAAVFEKILAPLVDDGYLAFAPSDLASAQTLLDHPGIDEVLMTGSAATYDRIVWGPPAEQAENKRAGRKQMSKPFEAELGGAAPVIVTPGHWTDKELDFQAAHIVASKVANGSHVCASPQLLVVARHWPQRQQFLDRVRHHLRTAPADGSFYPGAAERLARFQASSPGAEVLGPPRALDNQLDRVLLPDIAAGALPVTEEAFAPLLAEIALEPSEPSGFLAAATRFCNESLFGSLSCTILVDPRTEAELGGVLDDTIAALEYGSIGVNTWGALVVFFSELPWGAYPKHTAEDIQSGTGWIGNAYMVDGVEKAVFRAPITSMVHFQPARPKDETIMPRMARYQLRRSYGRLAKLLGAAVLGI